MDTPDPYVIVHIRNAPEGRKMTRHIDNVTDPEWDEELTYLLDPAEEKVTAEVGSCICDDVIKKKRD